MDSKDIFAKVQAIIAEKLDIDASSIKMESAFVNDLKADSMDILDLISGFEEEFSTSIPDEEARTFETVKQVVDYLVKLN